MLRGQRSRRSCSRLRLHHAATLFIACLALAHLLITYWTIQYEEVWAGLSPSQKLLRAVKVLLVDAYMPRTKVKSSSCQVADHIPKVALLFLATDGQLPHEAAWRSWLRSAEGLLPVAQISKGGVPPQLGLCAKALANSRGNPLSRQWLFSAYVHRPPGAPPLQSLHAFYGHEVQGTAQAEWGMHSAVAASRALLRAALKEPTNARFQLLSAATLPLWPPAVVYHRLMAQPRSHLDACHAPESAGGFWSAKGRAKLPDTADLRRSSQFITLTRSHAALVANESRVEPLFAAACTDDQAHDFRQLSCSSDEYYVPTLLSLSGLEQQTTCHGSVVQARLSVRNLVDSSDNWTPGSPAQNRSRFAVGDVTSAGLGTLRGNRGRCPQSAVLRAAQQEFHPISALAASRGSQLLPVPTDACGDGERLKTAEKPGSCFLFARRFPAATAQVVLDVWHDPAGDLSIIQEPQQYDPRTRWRKHPDCSDSQPG